MVGRRDDTVTGVRDKNRRKTRSRFRKRRERKVSRVQGVRYMNKWKRRRAWVSGVGLLVAVKRDDDRNR